ncbi:MFS transporter [Priestia megaterium]|uniref:MFS transporter n=1 Tax=Priestia megaterium TaxID=1404 RepID=UPI001F12F7D8|nr:MFS transporter [Priestia megaterium]UMZ36067.1 MFS transporter [Priestia megaterium]
MKNLLTYVSLLKIRPFSMLIIGSLLSNLAQSLAVVTIIWFIYQKTGSPWFIALSLISLELPAILLGPIWGTLLDRSSIVKLMNIANLSRALLFIFLIFTTLNNTLSTFVFFLLLALSSSLAPIVRSGENMLVVKIVDEKQLIAANSLMNIQFDFAYVIGPILGGIIATTSLGNTSFIVNALLFTIASFLFLFVKVPKTTSISTDNPYISQRFKNWLKDLYEGINFIFKNKSIAALISLNFLWNFLIWGTAPTLLPLFTQYQINAGATGYGILMAASSLGIIIGSLIIGMYKTKINPLKLVFISVGLHGFAYTLLASPFNLGVAVAILIFSGAISAPAMIYNRTILQTWVPQEKHGRVFTVSSTAGAIGFPLGNFLVAYFVSDNGLKYLPFAFLISGGILVLSTIIISLLLINKKEGNHGTSATSING